MVQVLEPFALLGGKAPVTVGQARVQFLSGRSQPRTWTARPDPPPHAGMAMAMWREMNHPLIAFLESRRKANERGNDSVGGSLRVRKKGV